MLGRYAVADALAIRYQGKLFWRQVEVHIGVLLAYIGFVSAAEFPELWWLRVVPAVFFIAAAVTYWRGTKVKLDNRSQDYRALAEGCRGRFFWSVAGVRESVRDHYLGEQRTELDWIRNALRGWEIDLDAGWPGAWANHHERVSFVADHWIDDQEAYFKKAEHRNHRTARRLGYVVRVCMAMAIILAAAVLSGETFSPNSPWLKSPYREMSVISVEFLLAAGALLHHFIERRAYHEHAKQYGRMRAIFQTASRPIWKALESQTEAGVSDARTWLQSLGEEALKENGDWVLLHRARPLELPHP